MSLPRLSALLLVLTITTGVIDAISVLGLGRVFTANMTGNTVFLGFALAGVPGFSPLRSVAALAAFLVGAVVGGRLGVHLDRSRRRRLFTIAAVESSVLFAAALAARGYDSETLAPVARLCALIALTAAAIGIRNATVRRLAVSDLTTTVLTLTLTGLGADSRLAGGSNPLALDGKGFVKTGAALTVDELVAAKWPLRRQPYLLQTSIPGVLAVGDVRSGSAKRVASAVGEGSIAIATVHQVLAE